MAKELTDKQSKFVDEYLIDLNATQAAIRAGYSEETARSIGNENLTKPYIQEAIQERIEERQKRTQITQDEVINELKAIAFANATDFAAVTKRGGVIIKNTDDLDDEIKKAIVSIKEGRNGTEVGMANKMQALEMLGRHLGMFKDKVEVSRPTGEITDEIDKYLAERMNAHD